MCAERTPQCTQHKCERDADAIYSNGPFQEPRCSEHAQGEHITVVRKL